MKKLLLLFFCFPLFASSQIVYVTPTGAGTNNGSSWGNAYSGIQLQAALDNVALGGEVWVAAGTYLPTYQTDGGDVRTKTFYINRNIKVYGGFPASGSPTMADRNPAANVTTLSGDIDVAGNNDSYHVVYLYRLPSTALLDGFTISDGRADGATNNKNIGGGIYNDGSGAGYNSNLAITNCIIKNCYATGGGGILNDARAGGITNPTLTNCTFMDNTGVSGGGIYNVAEAGGKSNPTITSCIFTNNVVTGIAGAILNVANASEANPTITQCTFTGNQAVKVATGTIGGAIVNDARNNGTTSGLIENCTFTNNISTYAGGAITNISRLNSGGTSSPTIRNCSFIGNVAQTHVGGAIFNTSYQTPLNTPGVVHPRIENCLFRNNAAQFGGAAYNYSETNGSCKPKFVNCTFNNNSAVQFGGTLGNNTANGITDVEVKNSIFWGNSGTDKNISIQTVTAFTITNSLLDEASCPANVTCGAGMIYNQNPLFVNQGGGNLRLQLCSPAINAGDNTGVSGTDLDNNPRVALTTVDMGAYEFQANTTTVIPVVITGAGPTTCGGNNGSITLSGLTPNLTYSITYKKDNVTIAAADFTANAGGIITLSNLTKGAYTNIVATYGRCSSAAASVTLADPVAPIITLTVNGQTAVEGNNLTLCDSDANPINVLNFNAGTGCVSGNLVWRTQIGAGMWSAWSSTIPTGQSSDNQIYRYQAACDIACETTYSGIISLTVNYRASTPQNVSLTADGITVNAGQSVTVCNLDGNTLIFNSTCAAGEILLYSVDGGDYSTLLPSQIVDNNFHNYRVRCRKADNTPSCVETESAVMSLKITTSGPAPTVSIAPLNGCGTPAAFSGSSNCGVLTTLWYNATTNQALPTLPTTTPNATTAFYARCQNEAGCLSEPSNTVTFTYTPVNETPIISASAEMVCTGTQVTISANCPAGSTAFWNTGVSTNSFQVAFSNVTQQIYWAKCIFPNGCQSPESVHKTIFWKAFELTFINIGQSQSGIKPANDRNLWANQFITKDAGPVLENSTEANPTIYYSENVNKTAPRFWTIQVEACALGTNGSVTYDMLATPEVGPVRSYNTHENNAPYLMYANREGFTELYAQNHPAYGFYQDNGSGGNVYDAGLPKGLYKLGIRYWDQKGQGSIYPSTRQPQGNVLAYQEYWFRIQSQNGVGNGAARTAFNNDQLNVQWAEVMPNPVTQVLHLKISEAQGQKSNFSLVDASGRTLLQRTVIPQTDQHQEEFDVSHLTNGMYFMRVNTDQKQATVKVLKVE